MQNQLEKNAAAKRKAAKKREKKTAQKNAKKKKLRVVSTQAPTASSAVSSQYVPSGFFSKPTNEEKNSSVVSSDAYLEVTLDGIIRIYKGTSCAGAYTEGLESCLALHIFNPINGKSVLIHKSAQLSMVAFDKELGWASDGGKTLGACQINIIYNASFPRQGRVTELRNSVKNSILSLKAEDPRVALSLQNPNMVACNGFVSISKDGAINTQAKPDKVESFKEKTKRDRINWVNNYFLTEREVSEFTFNISDFQFDGKSWMPMPVLLKSFSQMYAEVEKKSQGVNAQLYSWLCDATNNLEFWCQPGSLAELQKLSDKAGRDSEGNPHIRLLLTKTKVIGSSKDAALVTISREWVRSSSEKALELFRFISQPEYLIDIVCDSRSRNSDNANTLLELVSLVPKQIPAQSSKEEKKSLYTGVEEVGHQYASPRDESNLNPFSISSSLGQSFLSPPVITPELCAQADNFFSDKDFRAAEPLYSAIIEYYKHHPQKAGLSFLRKNYYALGCCQLKNGLGHQAFSNLVEACKLDEALAQTGKKSFPKCKAALQECEKELSKSTPLSFK